MQTQCCTQQGEGLAAKQGCDERVNYRDKSDLKVKEEVKKTIWSIQVKFKIIQKSKFEFKVYTVWQHQLLGFPSQYFLSSSSTSKNRHGWYYCDGSNLIRREKNRTRSIVRPPQTCSDSVWSWKTTWWKCTDIMFHQQRGWLGCWSS